MTLAHSERHLFRAKFNRTYAAASIIWFLPGVAPAVRRTVEAAGATPQL